MVELFLNETGFVGDILTGLTNNVTGSLFLTLLMIMLFFILMTLLFRFPIEFSLVLLLPLFLGFMAATSDFLALGGVVLIYLGIVFAKNFFIK